MKKFRYLIILFLAIFLFIPTTKAENKVDLYLFHSATCEHCQKERAYLEELKKDYPNLEVHLYEVTEDKDNSALMKKVKDQMHIDNQQVPFTIIGNTYYIGFEDSIKDSITSLVKEESNNPSINVVDKIFNDEDISDIEIRNGKIDKIVTSFGTIDPNKISLPILAVIIGFIDGFNPCAMWVLIFLISMLFNMKNKKRMWALGITFLTSSAFVYVLFMVAWIKIIGNLSSIVWFRLLISLVALIGGIINLRSYYKSIHEDSGCQVVDDKKRKKIFTRIKKIVGEKSFALALIGVALLAISVNVIELACSAGLPLIFTQILAINHITTLQYAIYIFIYIFFFLIDDIVVFTVAMLTLNITGISTKYTKYSHLIGGIIMVLIAVIMALKPEWLMMNFK